MLKRNSTVVTTACVLAFALASGAGPAAADERPLTEQAYAGLSLRDNSEGTVVGWVLPGPFEGRGFDSPTLRRGDLVVSVNDQAVTSEAFKRLLEASKPGDELKVVVKRGPKADAKGAVPRGDPDGETLTFTVKLDARDKWTGTIGRGVEVTTGVREPARGEFEDRIRRHAETAGVWADAPEQARASGLIAYLRGVQAKARDSFALHAIVDTFRRPLAVDRVEGEIAARVRKLAASPSEAALEEFVESMLDGETIAADAIEGAMPDRADTLTLVRHLRDSVTLEGEQTGAMIAVINRAEAGMDRYVFSPPTRISAEAAAESLAPLAKDAKPLVELPDDLAPAVTGEILYAFKLDDGRYTVIGGSGANSYRMDVVEVVYDVGGNDTYTFVDGKDGPSGGHAIVDLAGDDTYASESDFCGPGVAVFGEAIVDDRGGNDTYRSTKQFGIAAGLFGVGVIIDRVGDDRYENSGPGSGWSEGVGFYGVGLIIDGAGDDTYLGEKLCQGVGGPRGFGAIIDSTGEDSYKANGPSFKSAYDTPGVFLAMSQGFGLGVRGYASGGVGAIYDLKGRDHYDAGEFSQGCGYYYAMGVLHDGEGDDVYDGNRYSQAASAHQAIGVLIDDAGNDQYKGMTAASQAGAWDQSIAMLIDRAGDDRYAADGLSQGAAAQQAVGILIDLDGSDEYVAAGGADTAPGQGASVQGCSGGNEYHFAMDKKLSFSMLLDAGSGTDRFSTGRKGVLAAGVRNEKAPEQSTLFGVFADEEAAAGEGAGGKTGGAR
jgi:hypothetical protein